MAEVRQQRGSSGAEVSAISGSSQVWTEGPLAGEYLRGALHPALAKQVYEYSSEELMNRVDKSAVSLSANQELLAATEHRAKEWEDEAKKSQTELESLRNQRRELELEQEVGFLRFSLDGARNDRVIGLQRSVVRFHLFPLRQVGYRRGKRVILVRCPASQSPKAARRRAASHGHPQLAPIQNWPPTARPQPRPLARGRPATTRVSLQGAVAHDQPNRY
ncbi:hypothetical protein GW17_00048304 [Ensete ventricosum]|nr:hypothetical protein GW17_00048304 [Ensete ventricosum]